MIDLELVDVSRLQFAVTAMYHFLFVPLTLGLSWVLVIMESVYVMTGKEIYRDMTKFWGKLFGINFVMGVTTGITLEFQFGTDRAQFSTTRRPRVSRSTTGTCAVRGPDIAHPRPSVPSALSLLTTATRTADPTLRACT